MMDANVRMVINALAQDISQAALMILQENRFDDKVFGQGIEIQVKDYENPLIEFIFHDYMVLMIEDELSGNFSVFPSLSDIREWILSKGLSADNTTLSVVSEALWHIKNTNSPILEMLLNTTDELFETKWADILFQTITKDLINFFNE